MAGDTNIEWTHIHLPDGRIFRGRTWNPMTGCDRVSPGCENCYALTFAERFRDVPGHYYEKGFDFQLRLQQLEKPLHWKTPCGIFVNSMSDWCHKDAPDDYILSMFDVMLRADWHIYQLLTKRSPRMVRLVPKITNLVEQKTGTRTWPGHIWLGVSVESAEQRKHIARLRRVPAAVRFVSAEPLIGSLGVVDLTGIHWLIAGGESGQGDIRPMEAEWARELLTQCRMSGTAFFMKQMGTRWMYDHHPDHCYGEDPKGGHLLDLWPPDLRVREYPDLRTKEMSHVS